MRAHPRFPRGLLRLSTLVASVAIAACGGSDRRPDTGAGAGQIPPVTLNCEDLCVRAVDCAVLLCNEDTHSTRYDVLGPLLLDQCRAGCIDERVRTEVGNKWSCLFQSSCREVFDYNVCATSNTYYTCS